MKVIFLDNDGVICLSNNWGSRFKKQRREGYYLTNDESMPYYLRFDDFDQKSIRVLNKILLLTDAEIVVSSDWRLYATLEELGEYYLSQGIVKKPIGFTNQLQDCDQPTDFSWYPKFDLEQSRSLEIKQWLKDNPSVTHWVAVDDLDMSLRVDWGLENFALTPRKNEGIKQFGVSDKIIKFLM